MLIATITLLANMLTTMAQINDALEHGRTGETFSVSGTLTLPPVPRIIFAATDETGGTTLYVNRFRVAGTPPLEVGDQISASGRIVAHGAGVLLAYCEKIDKIGGNSAPQIFDIGIPELHSGRFDGQRVRLHGEVRECFLDEIDTSCFYLSISSGGISCYAVFTNGLQDFSRLKELEGSEVTVTGVCIAHDSGTRRLTGRTIHLTDAASLEVTRPAAANPFSAALLEDWMSLNPADLPALGARRLRGKVLAVLESGQALVCTGHQAFHRVSFKSTPPAAGQHIEAVGFPETDLYRINLSNAKWRPIDPFPILEDPPHTCRIQELLTDDTGLYRINTAKYGCIIRVRGEIKDMPSTGAGHGIVTLRDGDFTLPVDISACRTVLSALSIGCVAEFSGVCVINTENWSPCSSFPHTTGIILAVRDAQDVRILSQPPWWNAKRLFCVVCVLVLVLIGIFIWNRVLQRIVERKSRQLMKEQIGKVKAALRVDERTQLAVELHDSLSQNLSGVACQIAATRGTLPKGAERTAHYLTTAERMLFSCRTELRRCLWDLRGNALEVKDFSEAIRQTLAPVAIGVATTIRFHVPRSRLNDTEAHAVLCIIRELVANAVRHGKARSIRIAGVFHDGELSCSVRDDGRGFVPECCEGPAEGHFGLEGIRERIKRLDGRFTVSSVPGQGTRAKLTLPTDSPKPNDDMQP